MERQLEQLVRGDLSTRINVLQQADDALLAEIIRRINTVTEDMCSIEERYKLNALNHAYNNILKKLKNNETPFATKFKILKGHKAPLVVHKLLKLKKVQKRSRRDCPYPGCFKFGLLQLHNHLRQVHRLENKKDRQYWLDMARCGYKEQDNRGVGHLDASHQGDNNYAGQANKDGV